LSDAKDDDDGEDSADRRAILSRRARFVAAALYGLSLGAGGCDCSPFACLSPVAPPAPPATPPGPQGQGPVVPPATPPIAPPTPPHPCLSMPSPCLEVVPTPIPDDDEGN
jgi:hypothetical protein